MSAGDRKLFGFLLGEATIALMLAKRMAPVFGVQLLIHHGHVDHEDVERGRAVTADEIAKRFSQSCIPPGDIGRTAWGMVESALDAKSGRRKQ